MKTMPFLAENPETCYRFPFHVFLTTLKVDYSGDLSFKYLSSIRLERSENVQLRGGEYVSYPHQGTYINVTEANINHKQVNINNSNWLDVREGSLADLCIIFLEKYQ